MASAPAAQPQEEWKYLFTIPPGAYGKKALGEIMAVDKPLYWKGNKTGEIIDSSEKDGNGFLFTVKGSPDWYFARMGNDGGIKVYEYIQPKKKKEDEGATGEPERKSGEPVELTNENFERKIKKGWTLVDFWATWCGPCMALKPSFEAASREMAGQVKFGEVNVDQQRELSGRLQKTQYIPELHLYHDGKFVEQYRGSRDKESIKEWLQEKISQ